jgi:GAF domain-containing protein
MSVTSMHPPHDSLDDPHYYDEEPPYAILDLPPLCDEAALQFAELLKDLAGQFAEYYELQIQRAMRRRSLEEQKRFRRLQYLAAQMDLFDDGTDASKKDGEDPLAFNDDF